LTLHTNARQAVLLLCALLIGLAGPSRAPARENSACDAVGYLSRCLKNPKTVMVALATLKSAGGDETLPIFRRGLQSSHETVRIYCLDTVSEKMGKKAVDLLKKAFREDESPNVRAAALSRLMEHRAATPQMLAVSVNHKNEKLRCLTACAMVRLGKGSRVRSELDALTASSNPATEIMARVSLLKIGDTSQADRIRAMIRNRRMPDVVIALMCEQVVDQNVSAAGDLLVELVESRRSMGLRARAIEALAKVSDTAATTIAAQIEKSRNPVFAARLLKLLADQTNAAGPLRTIARSDDLLAPLARFELARAEDGRDFAGVTKRVISSDSLLPAAYIIARAEEDANSDTLAPKYVPALSHWLASLDGRTKTFKAEHLHAAKAVTVLVDVGQPEGLRTIRTLLRSRYSARTRAVAMGLVKAESTTAIALAGPLLKSPYPKLVRSAAMTLGQFGRKSGREELVRIALAPEREGVPTACLANWYILKIDGEAKAAARTLAGVLP
jgi:HEAT repeat protein